MTGPGTRTYAAAPSTLPLYVRAVLPALPLVGSLPGIRHRSGEVPALVLERTGVRTDTDHLADYAALCGFRLGGTVPTTYPHLAAFGLQLALMADSSFPFAPMGVVHVANTIDQHRPLGVDEVYDVRVQAANLRPHPRGRLIDLVSSASVAGEPVWSETMTLLSRGRSDDSVADPLPLRDAAAPAGDIRWPVAADLGRRYASVSGDRNPIHLYGVTAQAFGFPRQIAHGMWTKARCLAALQNRLPDAFCVTVAFRKPVLLPTTVTFGASAAADSTVFGVTSPRDGATHLVGRVSAG